jgi:hypothetical protein
MEVAMDTSEIEAPVEQEQPTTPLAGAAQAAERAAQRAEKVVVDVAGAAASAVQTHAPGVLEASRATAGTAYGQVRQASDQQLIVGSAFLGGLVTGLLLARVPRILVLLVLAPLAVLGGTLLGRRLPFGGGEPSRND